MARELSAYLYDIVEACDAIEDVMTGVTLGHLEKLVFCRRPAAMKKPPWRRPGGEKISGARINTPSHACFA
jgi:hypothetical protein